MPEPTVTTPLHCAHCARTFPVKRDLIAHARSHEAASPCPECGGLYKNITQHRTLTHKARPPAALPPATGPTMKPGSGLGEAIRALIAAAESVRGAVMHLEEENKMLRRDLDKANSALERARNFLGSK